MIIVIQCAGTKKEGAGHLHTKDGNKVMFVAHPSLSPVTPNVLYARPDDRSDQSGTWRDVLVKHNAKNVSGEGQLLRALDLYYKPAYRQLARQVGYQRTYILSAGWGLVRGDCLLPDYDITFSGAADAYKRRGKKDIYHDFSDIPDDFEDEVFFFGGLDYLPLFCKLTERLKATRTVYFSATQEPDAPGCRLVRFGKPHYNWHYGCLTHFLNSHA